MRLVIAARKSDLARLQAYQVGEALEKAHPHLQIQYHFRESLGDREQSNPLWQMPAKGVFTEDFVGGLESGEFDLVVHSWKDLPTEKRENTEVVATMKRADARDVLLVRKSALTEDRKSWRVLSSSPRRVYFLQKAWPRLAPRNSPALEFHSVRGNIPTRLTRLHEGQGEALLVAKAALDRLLSSTRAEFNEAQAVLRKVLQDSRFMVIPLQIQPPAPAQGALAIEIRKGRPELRELLAAIHCPATFAAAEWERSQLATFGGGCHLKLGALQTQLRNFKLRLVMGAPPQGEPVERIWLEKDAQTAPPAKRVAGNFRSDDFYDIDTVPALTAETALYVSHKRAWSAAYHEQAEHVWTSGLAAWEFLAEKGVWVNGSSEGWGETRPDVDELAGKKIAWLKLSHDQAPADTMPKLTTYRMVLKTDIAPGVRRELESATHFFWHAGAIFDAAEKFVPSIRAKHHSSGLGNTREHLERRLGELGPDQLFLNESDWRRYYGL